MTRNGGHQKRKQRNHRRKRKRLKRKRKRSSDGKRQLYPRAPTPASPRSLRKLNDRTHPHSPRLRRTSRYRLQRSRLRSAASLKKKSSSRKKSEGLVKAVD